jgi:hypothetical protein
MTVGLRATTVGLRATQTLGAAKYAEEHRGFDRELDVLTGHLLDANFHGARVGRSAGRYDHDRLAALSRYDKHGSASRGTFVTPAESFSQAAVGVRDRSHKTYKNDRIEKYSRVGILEIYDIERRIVLFDRTN